MRDAVLVAGKGVEKANEYAEVACEAGATIGEILDPSTTQGQRRDLTFRGLEKFDGPPSTATDYRNMARVPPEKRRPKFAEVAALLGVARETVRDWFMQDGGDTKTHKPKLDARGSAAHRGADRAVIR